MDGVDGNNICIVCINVAFANAGALQNALDCQIAIQQAEKKGYGSMLTRAPVGIKNLPKVDHYIFAGSGILQRIDVSILKGRKTVIISDSHYLQNTKEIDDIIEKNNIEVFCMADLWKFCKFDKRMYIHPFLDIPNTIKKNDIFTVCHSPYHKVETNQKGSVQIGLAVERLHEVNPLVYRLIIDKTWKQTLDIKAASHFFIDQISFGNHYSSMGYEGGLGKSGLEGMLLKCLTFCSGSYVNSDIPHAPYVLVRNEHDLLEKMEYYICREKEREKLIDMQYAWSKKYTNHIEVAKRILK